MDPSHWETASALRLALARSHVPHDALRAALTRVPPLDRDAWVDVVFSLDSVPDDGPELPPGCVPYLPCPVGALLEMIDLAPIDHHDVFVDVGCGVGRAAVLVHLLTGATAFGLEIQPALVDSARALKERAGCERLTLIEGDAVHLAGTVATGSVFFLFCPFSGARLESVLDSLEPIAKARTISICSVDLPLPHRDWLALRTSPTRSLTVYQSTHADLTRGDR